MAHIWLQLLPHHVPSQHVHSCLHLRCGFFNLRAHCIPNFWPSLCEVWCKENFRRQFCFEFHRWHTDSMLWLTTSRLMDICAARNYRQIWYCVHTINRLCVSPGHIPAIVRGDSTWLLQLLSPSLLITELSHLNNGGARTYHHFHVCFRLCRRNQSLYPRHQKQVMTFY